jgi:hypothetical protein
MRQHLFQAFGGRMDVDVFDLFVLFAVSFPSCDGKRSGVFSEDEDFFSHNTSLPKRRFALARQRWKRRRGFTDNISRRSGCQRLAIDKQSVGC